MGMANRAMMEREEEKDRIASLLVKHGYAEHCEYHGYTTTENTGSIAEEADIEDPDEIALIGEVLDELGMECPGCANNAAE
jgi:hypothetical protein